MTKQHDEWFEFADSDLGFAASGMRDEYYGHVCLLSQQAIEKALKGYLIYKTGIYPKIHKLVELALMCKNKKLDKFQDGLKLVDAYYIPTRYPGGFAGGLPQGLPGKREAEEALSIAEEVVEVVKKIVYKKRRR